MIWLSLTPHPPEPVSFAGVDKLEHLAAYGCLMLWFSVAYRGRARWIVAGWLIVLGVALEILQGWGGIRYFEYADMAANSSGVLLSGWLASRLLARRIDRLASYWAVGTTNN